MDESLVKTPHVRPDWDVYFMEMAKLVSSRSTCLRRAVGAVLVKDRRMLATGYNGAPTGMFHCDAIGCMRNQMSVPSGERHELCRGLHAEQNAVIQAAFYGISIRDSHLYCTNHPCATCAKMLINAGIKRIVYLDGYQDSLATQMFSEVKMKMEKLEGASQ